MTKALAVRIEETLLQAVDAVLRTAGGSRSDAVREGLRMWLKQKTLADQVRRHREGYARHPVGKDEFAPVLEAQTWPK